LDRLTGIPTPAFTTLEIDCTQITTQYTNWVEELQRMIPNKSTPVLYYFTLSDAGLTQTITSNINTYKTQAKESNNYRAFPKVNNKSVDLTQVLYVGKTNTNFVNRFQQHLGLKNPKTYSLQLLHWACALNVDLTLHYAPIALNSKDIRFLEQMESVLHEQLKPILGRSGH
jgi:hypothetical protein